MDEVDITDIPIARVAEQYLEYLELMRELQLDVAGEYLVMAATLAWIKSRMLLPPDPSAIGDEGLDPRAELVARLLEYQRFKEVAGEIGERSLLGPRRVLRASRTGSSRRRRPSARSRSASSSWSTRCAARSRAAGTRAPRTRWRSRRSPCASACSR